MRPASSAILFGLLLALPLAGQEPPRLPSIELPSELDRVLRDYEREWTNGDAAALSLLFTDDGFASSSAGWVRGRDRIRNEYGRAGGELRLRALAYAADDSIGYIVGAYGWGAAAAVSDSGKFVLALRRAADGKWLIAADLDNSNGRPDVEPASADEEWTSTDPVRNP